MELLERYRKIQHRHSRTKRVNMIRKAFVNGRFRSGMKLIERRSPSRLYVRQQQRVNHDVVAKHLLEIQSQHQIVDIELITKRLGVRLTETEFSMLREMVDVNKDGLVSRTELTSAGRQALDDHSAREVCLSVVEVPTTQMDRVGSWAVSMCDYGGTALYAIVGSQIAGGAGMNMIGCTLVGCAAAMGGGTLNNLMYGATSTLHGRPGVFWVRDTSYLALCVTVSLMTFFLWPEYCHVQADHYLMNVVGEENLEEDGTIGREAFVDSCKRDADFFHSVQGAIGRKAVGMDANEVFNLLDDENSGTVSRRHLRVIVERSVDNSLVMYVVDTLALSAFAVAAVNGAIAAGVHPAVAATSGVTVCFGGIFRDVFCGRNLAIGGQSYAFATGAGSSVYVLLRELAIRGIQTSLFTRVILSAGTTAGLRAWEYRRGEPLLKPMHFEATD